MLFLGEFGIDDGSCGGTREPFLEVAGADEGGAEAGGKVVSEGDSAPLWAAEVEVVTMALEAAVVVPILLMVGVSGSEPATELGALAMAPLARSYSADPM